MQFLLQLLTMIFGELIKQLPEFLTQLFSSSETVEVKDGNAYQENNDSLLDNDAIDKLLG
jgi:hypothetical protein